MMKRLLQLTCLVFGLAEPALAAPAGLIRHPAVTWSTQWLANQLMLGTYEVRMQAAQREGRTAEQWYQSEPGLQHWYRAIFAQHAVEYSGQRTVSSGPLRVALLDHYSVMRRFSPDQAAVELTFVNKDGAATLKLGQARGIAMLVPARAGIDVGEYAPNAVKKAVVGVGHADKRQVDHMVRMQLPGVEIAGPDAADALAVAICHAHMCQTRARVAV